MEKEMINIDELVTESCRYGYTVGDDGLYWPTYNWRVGIGYDPSSGKRYAYACNNATVCEVEPWWRSLDDWLQEWEPEWHDEWRDEHIIDW